MGKRRMRSCCSTGKHSARRALSPRQGIPSAKVLDTYRQALLSADEVLPRSYASLMVPCSAILIYSLILPVSKQHRLACCSSLLKRQGLFSAAQTAHLKRLCCSISRWKRSWHRSAKRSRARSSVLLFTTIGARLDKQATYHAARVYRETGLDPRMIDPLLTRLGERDLLLYRPYSRGMTLKIGGSISGPDESHCHRARFADRYERFEERLQKMLDYIHLQEARTTVVAPTW